MTISNSRDDQKEKTSPVPGSLRYSDSEYTEPFMFLWNAKVSLKHVVETWTEEDANVLWPALSIGSLCTTSGSV